jgi:myo-inositol-1-phosphate synthase
MQDLPEIKIKSPKGKLGILTPGVGAVATTFIAGVIAIRNGLAKPIGSLTQMGTIRLGKRTEGRSPLIKEFVPLAELNDLYFGGWDIFPDNAYESARNAGVLQNEHLDPIRSELEAIKPWPGVFNREYVKKLDGHYVKKASSKWDYAQMVMEDIREFTGPKGNDLVWQHGNFS